LPPEDTGDLRAESSVEKTTKSREKGDAGALFKIGVTA
jgi:hypothetical protein